MSERCFQGVCWWWWCLRRLHISSKTSSQRSGRVRVLWTVGIGDEFIKLSTRTDLVLGVIGSILTWERLRI